MSKKKKKHMTTVQVPVDLTVEEKAKTADELLEIHEAIATLTEEMKEANAKMKESIAEQETKASHRYKVLKKGFKEVPTDCSTVKNFETGFKEFRDKEGVLVHQVPLSGEDHILEIDDEIVGTPPDTPEEEIEI